ncbi:MAG: histidine kinase [Proteobacteria bacterium]|nr:histidine kinase [Pseudomonadota bacterium]
MPKAAQGVIDLSTWDFERQGPVRLDGQWEVRWERLLEPAELAALDQSPSELATPAQAAPDQTAPSYANVPGPWSQNKPGASALNATGCATMRLLVHNLPTAGQTALRLTNICTAWTLWVNGRQLAHSGIPAEKDHIEEPRLSSMVIPLHTLGDLQTKTEPLELVLQISNQYFREGGPIAPLWIGPESTMLAQALHDTGIAMFLAGVLFIMGVYHVALYFFRRRDTSPLLFAIYCLLWLGNYSCSESSGWVVLTVLPNLPALGLEHFAIACFFLSVPVGFAFFRSLYPREFSRLVQHYSWATGGAFTLLAALGSSLTLTTALPLYYLSSVALILYCFARLYRAWRRGREGAHFIFLGFLVLGLIGINDMLNDLRIINTTPLLVLGMLIFIMSQAFALSQRLSRAFSSVETLSVQLESKNLTLETEMAERNRLEREIINISEEERRRISVDLHDGLCQLLTAARLRCSVLLRMDQTEGRNAELGQLSGLLDQLVDQAYDVSHGLWPQEHNPASSGPSLTDLIRRFSLSSGVPIEFTRNQACETCPPNANVTQLYRIGQEALSNAVKHARATRIDMDCSCSADGMVTISVRDNGIGRARAAKSKGGLGTGIMAHRARMIGGELNIQDAEGGGTVVSCTAPCGHCSPSGQAPSAQTRKQA